MIDLYNIEIGDDIVYIDNFYISLTVGKTYKVLGTLLYLDKILINDNLGYPLFVESNCFMILKEYNFLHRYDKIIKLL